MIKQIIIAISAVGLTACASYQPVVDLQSSRACHNLSGQDCRIKYHHDLAQCQQHARQVSPAGDTLTHGAAGAGLGALLGVIGGAAVDDVGGGAAVGAATGGALGAGHGLYTATTGQKDIIRRCMQARGYTVLQ